MCIQIPPFKGNLHPEYERITPVHSVASGEKQTMLPLSDHSSRVDYHYVHPNTSIQRQLTNFKYEWITPFHSVASGEKEQIMLPLSDHFTRQG